MLVIGNSCNRLLIRITQQYQKTNDLLKGYMNHSCYTLSFIGDNGYEHGVHKSRYVFDFPYLISLLTNTQGHLERYFTTRQHLELDTCMGSRSKYNGGS